MRRKANDRFAEEGVVVHGDGKGVFPREDEIHVELEGTGKFSKLEKTGQCFTLGEDTVHV